MTVEMFRLAKRSYSMKPEKKLIISITAVTFAVAALNAADISIEHKAETEMSAADKKTNKNAHLEQKFKKCATCHGQKGEKKAFDRSRPIGNLSEEEIKTSLQKYKKGSFKTPLKKIMHIESKRFTDDEISDLAKFIAHLKN